VQCRQKAMERQQQEGKQRSGKYFADPDEWIDALLAMYVLTEASAREAHASHSLGRPLRS
jgi:hypothetical protein